MWTISQRYITRSHSRASVAWCRWSGRLNIPNGKAILVTDNDVTIDHFEFSGARVGDQNGAGIRYEAGNLTITNSYFHNNENGLLGAPDPNGTITVRNSEFAYNGDRRWPDPQHLCSARSSSSRSENSYFHDANIGHEIKSRALNNTITGSRIFNNNGNASYEIDLPQGGNGLIQGNIIQQGTELAEPKHHRVWRRGQPSGAELADRTRQHHRQRPRRTPSRYGTRQTLRRRWIITGSMASAELPLHSGAACRNPAPRCCPAVPA